MALRVSLRTLDSDCDDYDDRRAPPATTVQDYTRTRMADVAAMFADDTDGILGSGANISVTSPVTGAGVGGGGGGGGGGGVGDTGAGVGMGGGGGGEGSRPRRPPSSSNRAGRARGSTRSRDRDRDAENPSVPSMVTLPHVYEEYERDPIAAVRRGINPLERPEDIDRFDARTGGLMERVVDHQQMAAERQREEDATPFLRFCTSINGCLSINTTPSLRTVDAPRPLITTRLNDGLAFGTPTALDGGPVFQDRPITAEDARLYRYGREVVDAINSSSVQGRYRIDPRVVSAMDDAMSALRSNPRFARARIEQFVERDFPRELMKRLVCIIYNINGTRHPDRYYHASASTKFEHEKAAIVAQIMGGVFWDPRDEVYDQGTSEQISTYARERSRQRAAYRNSFH